MGMKKETIRVEVTTCVKEEDCREGEVNEEDENVDTVVWRWLQGGVASPLQLIDVHNLLSNLVTEGDGQGKDLRNRTIVLDFSEWSEGTFKPHLESRVSRLMLWRRPSYLDEKKWKEFCEAEVYVEDTGGFVHTCWQYLGEVLGRVADECFVMNDEDGRFAKMLEKYGLRVYNLDERETCDEVWWKGGKGLEERLRRRMRRRWRMKRKRRRKR